MQHIQTTWLLNFILSFNKLGTFGFQQCLVKNKEKTSTKEISSEWYDSVMHTHLTLIQHRELRKETKRQTFALNCTHPFYCTCQSSKVNTVSCLITIHTVQSYLSKATQGLSTSYGSCCRLFETTEVLPFICIFFLHVLLTGLVRRRTVDRWRRSTASIRTSKQSSVYWRPCSVNNRTQPKAVELTHSGTFI